MYKSNKAGIYLPIKTRRQAKCIYALQKIILYKSKRNVDSLYLTVFFYLKKGKINYVR